MEMRACLCLDTDMETIEGCGAAELNLVLRGEALPAAEILEKNCNTPCVAGMPYGYAGTLDWLHRVGAALGREPNGALVRELEARHAEAAQMRMYGMMLKRDRPAATLFIRRIRDGAGTRRPAGRDGCSAGEQDQRSQPACPAGTRPVCAPPAGGKRSA